MITEKAKKRMQIIAFFEKHGLEACLEAFEISERTLYEWRKKLKDGDGKAESLNETSTRPKTLRKREWPFVITQEIRRLREEHPNLGKNKIRPLLKRFCEKMKLDCPCPETIGNLIRDMGGLRKFPKKIKYNGRIVREEKRKKIRKPKHFKATHAGHCVSLDTVERFVHGNKRYIVTFTDLYSRFSFAAATTSHASLFAKQFFEVIQIVFPYKMEYVLTDNGSEFLKHFDEELRNQHLTHWHTYPKTPKMNAHCERFNRTIQEEFVDYHAFRLLNPDHFNEKLIEYLLWYNTERPHHALNYQSPLEFLTHKIPEDCKMSLAHTCY